MLRSNTGSLYQTKRRSPLSVAGRSEMRDAELARADLVERDFSLLHPRLNMAEEEGR